MEVSRARRAYRALALTVFNTVLVFLLLNGVLWVAYRLKAHWSDPLPQRMDSLRKVYPSLDDEEIEALFEETWSRTYSYEPFTQFKESPFEGRFVNVSPQGYRLSRNQGPWPPPEGDFNVLVFGGSTAFGYGLPDDQTIASYLQEALSDRLGAVHVYNFGRGHYFSAQERALFESLLAADVRPRLAVFIDGLNEFSHPRGEPRFTRELEDFVQRPEALSRVLSRLPVASLVESIRSRIELPAAEDEADPAEPSRTVIERYLKNKALIEAAASGFGVELLFVWQPIPSYGYDLEHHLFREEIPLRHRHSGAGYQMMLETAEQRDLGGDFLWCADLQLGLEEPLYVDAVHYGPKLSRLLAQRIAEAL